MNTLAAARMTPIANTATRVGPPARSASRPLSRARASAKARTKSAIAVSLKALWARNEAPR